MAVNFFMVASMALVALTIARTSKIAEHCKLGRPFMKNCNVCWCSSNGTVEGCTNYECENGANATSNTRNHKGVFRQRIVGGEYAGLGDLPYQALLASDYKSFCGASLISKSAVLTAAHCVQGFITFDVSLATLETFGSHSKYVQHFVTRRGVVHRQFDNTNLRNDLAVVFLGREVVLSPFIKIVKLPSKSDVRNTFMGDRAIASGWGKTSDKSEVSPYLKKVMLTIISNWECAETYTWAVVTPSIICARGDARRSTCEGDSGGPLVVGRKGNYKLIGVSSFGSTAGCELGRPVGFSRVTWYLDWIASTANVRIQ